MYQGKWAVVTGASSGIGKEIALQLSAYGMNLVLVARREAILEEMKNTIVEVGCSCEILPLDLSLESSVGVLKNWLIEHSIHPCVVVNNAGVGLYGDFLTQDTHALSQMLNLNVNALTMISREIVPLMEKGGHLMLVSSTIAYIPSPKYCAYAATKSYVHSFGYALADALYPDISVTTLYPGVTNTEFFDVSHHPMAGWLKKIWMYEPECVARAGLQALFAKKARCIPGMLNRCMVYSTLMLPDYWRRGLLKKIFELSENTE